MSRIPSAGILAAFAMACIVLVFTILQGLSQDPTSQVAVEENPSKSALEETAPTLEGSTEDPSLSKQEDPGSGRSESDARQPIELEVQEELPSPMEITPEDRVEHVRQQVGYLQGKAIAYLKGEVKGELADLFTAEDRLWIENVRLGEKRFRVRTDVFDHLVAENKASRLRVNLRSLIRIAEGEEILNPSFILEHMTADEDPLKPFK